MYAQYSEGVFFQMAEVITQHYDYIGDAELLVKQVYGRIGVMFLGHEVDVVVSMPDGSSFNKFIPSHADEALVKSILTEKLEEHLTAPSPVEAAPVREVAEIVAPVLDEPAVEAEPESDASNSKKSKNK